MTVQHSHSTNPFLPKKFPVILICDGIQSPANVGGLFRLCDAFGIQEITFCNATIDFTSARLRKTSRNTHERVSYSVKDDIVSELKNVRKKGYYLIALEICDKSIPLEELSIANQKIALIIGNEQHGISNDVLEEVKLTTHIEMFGSNSSMNVVQATGIALHSIISKIK